jgi:pimeloyl-ACP methyl ester carboxylesterase
MATYILIHGGCTGGWSWDLLLPHLRRRGHTVLAPDLPGMGSDKTPLSLITLDYWADFVAGLIRNQSERVILVGRSRGGIVISRTAEKVPDRIEALVYVAAMLVPNGESMGNVSNWVPRDTSYLILSEDGTTYVIDRAKAKLATFNTTPDEVAERMLDRFCPEPAGSFVWPVVTSEARFGSVPRIYVETLRDNAIPIALQRMMQKALPCRTVITMDTDHAVSTSGTIELSAHLSAISEYVGGN